MINIFKRIFGKNGSEFLMEFSLKGDIPEYEEKGLFSIFGGKKVLTVFNIERLLIHAETNEYVRGVVLKISDLRIGLARANTIRIRIKNLRDKGVPVYAYLESGGNTEYLIASAANYVFLAPWATLTLIGLKAEVTFYKDVLQKLGVTAHMKGLGKYKSAAETFTRGSMSAPHREMIESIINDLGEQLEEAISEGRGIKAAQVKKLIDQGPFVGEEATNAGLVDGLLYESDLGEKIAEITGEEKVAIDAAKVLKSFRIRDFAARYLGRLKGDGHVIAVVSDVGMITLGESRGGAAYKTIGSSSLIELLDKASEDNKVRALVLRVLSPGGSGVASDLIWKKVKLISERKPVVVSMSDVAASGGYLIALGGQKIIADSMSITGSIGIVAGKFNLEGFYEKIGIGKDWYLRGKNSSMFSPSKGFSSDEDKKLTEIIEFYYCEFVKKVSKHRRINYCDAETVARGRVWTGKQAKEHGLIDETGGITEAINIARLEAGIKKDTVTVTKFYSKPSGMKLSSFLKATSLTNTLDSVISIVKALEREDFLALMPFDIKFK